MAESGLHLLPKNLCDITPSRKCEHPITKCEHPSTKSHHPSTLARSTPPGFSASPTSTARLEMKKNKKTKQRKDENKCPFPESGNHQDCRPHHVLQHYGALTLKSNMLISLQVLYLYNNKIRTMEALESAPNIELLYLQV